MEQRPVTTLFMLSSLDGKISTGANDSLDVDQDFPKLPGLREGLHQYYEIEQTTDIWSLNSGRVMVKVGANDKPYPEKTPVNFVVLDNSHLNEHGVRFFCARSNQFVLVTSNPQHPAYAVEAENMHILFYEKLDLKKMLEDLRSDFGCESITIQTGGTLNGRFLREGLFDYVDIVVAPVLIGGKDTSTLVDGVSLTSPAELGGLGILKLISCEALEDSYVHLRYEVVR